MWNSFLTFCGDIVPKGDRILMLTSGGLGAWATWAFGGLDVKIQYLFFFVVLDYVTGNIAAFKTGAWCSKTGFTGISRKVFIFIMVAFCHGLDVIAGFGDIMRNAAIIAYTVNEAASIIENAETLGFGGYVPAFIRRGLKTLKEKEDNLFKGEDLK